MAPDSHSPSSAAALIAEIARNREQLAAHSAQLRQSLDVRHRAKSTFQQHTGAFIGSAAVLGLLLAFLPSSRKARAEKRAARLWASAPPPPPPSAREERKQRKAESQSLIAILLGLAGKAALDMGKPILLKMLRDHFLAPHVSPPRPASSASYAGRTDPETGADTAA